MRPGTLRAQLETVLGKRAPSFTDLDQRVYEHAATGIPALDASTGGLPRGGIIEIAGPLSSGRTSLAFSILAAASNRGEACALIDGMDAFDPASGAAAGIELRRLLWIRCHNLDQTLRSMDLLLQGGGFGLVAADLSDLPQQAVRSVPLAAWFRLQRVIENTPASLLVIARESVAKSAATLVLQTSAHPARGHAHWTGPDSGPSHGLLLASQNLNIEVIRSRISSNTKFRHVCVHPYS